MFLFVIIVIGDFMIKRGKIKDKYLHYDIDNKNGDNAFDRAEGNIFNFLKFIGVLLLLLQRLQLHLQSCRNNLELLD